MLAVLTGLAVGVLSGVAAGARRTATAFDRFVSSAGAVDVTVDVADRAAGVAAVSSPGVASAAHFGPVPQNVFRVVNGRLTFLPAEALIMVADDSFGVNVERPSFVEGRRPVVGELEAWSNPAFLEQVGVEVGDRIELATLPDEVVHRLGGDFDRLAAAYQEDRSLGRSSVVSIVGSGVRAADLIRDAASRPGYLVLDRRSVARVLDTSLSEVDHLFDEGHLVAIKFAPGADVDAEIARVSALGIGSVTLEAVRGDVNDSSRPYAIALASFAALLALVVIVVVGGAFGRQASSDSVDDHVLRVLGADRLTFGFVAAGRAAIPAVVGVVVATIVAVAMSPLFPLGPVADVEPSPGLSADLTVLVPVALTVIVAAVVIGVMASKRQRHIVGSREPAGAMVTALADRLPVAEGIGLLFAFPPPGRARVLMRTTIVALTVAVVAGFGVAIFASSMDDLLDHPPRHGWAWDIAVTCNQGYCGLPPELVDTLRADGRVDASNVIRFDTVELDGHTVPVMALGAGDLQPLAVADGRAPTRSHEIALGALTMQQLDVNVGDEVDVGPSGTLAVVGEAVFSGLGPADSDRAALGSGAAMTQEGFDALGAPPIENEVLVLSVNQDIAAVADDLRDQLRGLTVLELRRPAELVAWPDLRRLPLLLGVTVGILALAAVAHGFALSTRIHRRDLAVLSALGLQARQLRRVVSGQAVAVLTAAMFIGAPLGTIAGLAAWRALIEQLGVTSAPAINLAPAVSATAIFLAVMACIILTGTTTARRTTTAADLRRE